MKPGGRCLFEVYNKEFGEAHGVQDVLDVVVLQGGESHVPGPDLQAVFGVFRIRPLVHVNLIILFRAELGINNG